MNKKQHPKFNVPNFGARNRSGVKERWRKQRGIDNKKRIKKSFMGAEPTIGYRNPEQLRFLKANGKRTLLIHSMREFNEMLENPDIDAKGFDVTIAHEVSRRLRAEIVKAAEQNKMYVTNGGKKPAAASPAQNTGVSK